MVPSSSPPPYEITIGGFAPTAFQVHALRGREVLSEPWSLEVEVTCVANDTPVEEAALGERATVVLNVGTRPRAFYGVVAAVRLTEAHSVNGAVKYVVRVVPRLWLLKKKIRSRIFQYLRVPDIAAAVLAEAGIASRWQLSRDYPPLEFVTQYEESDLHFVTRILAEAGIFFYFAGGEPHSLPRSFQRNRRASQ